MRVLANKTMSAARLIEQIQQDVSTYTDPLDQHPTDGLIGLQVFPSRDLTFNVTRPSAQEMQHPHIASASRPSPRTGCAISLRNSLNQRLYFRFKTNKDDRYKLRPKEGIVRPNSVMTIWANVNANYVQTLLRSGRTGALQCNDVVLVALVKLSEEFCGLYDTITDIAHKSAVVNALGESLRVFRPNARVPTWYKWHCSYVIAQLPEPSPMPTLSRKVFNGKQPRVSYGFEHETDPHVHSSPSFGETEPTTSTATAQQQSLKPVGPLVRVVGL